MPRTATLPDVRPISDLRTHLPEIEESARETGEPIVLTRNGASSLIVMDAAAYNEQKQHERAVRKLREAEIEAKYLNETYSHEQVWARVQDIIASAKTAHA